MKGIRPLALRIACLHLAFIVSLRLSSEVRLCAAAVSLLLGRTADGVEERSLVPRSRSHTRLKRNATMSHAFSCEQPAFIDL
ncbi:hypothetical protein EVAR_98549_1 [Eumeta japonica]|uniref:Secreted protein n=1 Tax=Eumeta variegata TaxID=151549 RepID=A0A4C1YM69_EUMVA|nr:hypothetical protein EVAR_98549_1 [Eumeta japonica]